MKYLLAASIIMLAGSAQAETLDFTCKVGNRRAPLQVDLDHNTITWNGKTYTTKDQESCARMGWHAEGPGEPFDFCIATQGYADISGKTFGYDCRAK